MEFISYKAPQNSLTAGRVLQHSKQVLDMLFRKHAPMIFKIGFTHNPIWRWTNDIYGYAFAVERWTNMVVLYETQEPFSPAMLEAALIDLYKCYSLARLFPVDLDRFYVSFLPGTNCSVKHCFI